MTRTARRARSIAGAWCAAVLVHAVLLAGAFALPLRTQAVPRGDDEPEFAIRVSRSSLPELCVEPPLLVEAPIEPPIAEPGVALVPPPEPEPVIEEPTAALVPAPVVADVIEEPAPASDAPVQPIADAQELPAVVEPVASAAPAIGVGGDAGVASTATASSPSASSAAPTPAAAPGAGSEGVAGATGNAASTSTGRGAIAIGPTRAVRPLTNPKPIYPRTSIRFREEGEVLCRLEIDARGVVTAVSVARSSGSKRLDDAALDAVRRWTFAPALRDGVAEATSATLPIVFRLRDAR